MLCFIAMQYWFYAFFNQFGHHVSRVFCRLIGNNSPPFAWPETHRASPTLTNHLHQSRLIWKEKKQLRSTIAFHDISKICSVFIGMQYWFYVFFIWAPCKPCFLSIATINPTFACAETRRRSLTLPNNICHGPCK